jgi:5-methylcytosine-specific restriction endonuclease McrA
MLTFEEWIQLPILDENKAIRGGRFSIRQPEVMVTLEYNRFPERDVKLNKKNLWLRDEKVCQYTGKSLTYDEASLDHVFPQSKGGLSTWENMVICCREVNSRKADRTPEEAGLKLRKKPIRPKWHPKYARYSSLITPNSPESWKRYVSIDAMI